MSTKPFFSGRIPQSLYDALEEYRQKTNESKTDILIKALSSYVDHPVELSDSPQSFAVETSKIEVLGKKVKALEEDLQAVKDLLATKLGKPISEQLSSRTNKVEKETGQFLLTLKEDVIERDNKADINSVSNQNLVTILDNESDIHSQTSDNSKDNSDDNNQIEKLEQGSLTPKPSGIFIGNMRTVEVTKLPGLEEQRQKIIGGKLNRIAKSEFQTAIIETYTCIYTGRTDKRGKTGQFEMLWDVYQNS